MANKIDYSRFTPQQLEAAKLLAEPYTEDGKPRKFGEIAEMVGVTERTLYTWRQDDSFRELVNDLADKAMDAFLPKVYASLMYRVENDKSDKALELALKRMGRLKDVTDVNATIRDSRDNQAIEDEIEALKRELGGSDEE